MAERVRTIAINNSLNDARFPDAGQEAFKVYQDPIRLGLHLEVNATLDRKQVENLVRRLQHHLREMHEVDTGQRHIEDDTQI